MHAHKHTQKRSLPVNHYPPHTHMLTPKVTLNWTHPEAYSFLWTPERLFRSHTRLLFCYLSWHLKVPKSVPQQSLPSILPFLNPFPLSSFLLPPCTSPLLLAYPSTSLLCPFFSIMPMVVGLSFVFLSAVSPSLIYATGQGLALGRGAEATGTGSRGYWDGEQRLLENSSTKWFIIKAAIHVCWYVNYSLIHQTMKIAVNKSNVTSLTSTHENGHFLH